MTDHAPGSDRSLPERLPDGERILWQGAPTARGIALRALHVRGVAIYFGLLLAYFAWRGVADGTPWPAAIADVAVRVLPVAAAVIGILVLFAWLIHRTTSYTITSRRLIMKVGLALPMTVNVPFARLVAADLRQDPDGTGDISVAVDVTHRMSLVVLWPHFKPWHTTRPQPMLRSVPDAARVADILAAALAVHAGQAVPARTAVTTPTTAGETSLAPRPASPVAA